MRARAWVLALAMCASCTRVASVSVADADASAVIVALLDAEGGVEALELVAGRAGAPFTPRLDRPYPIVSFPLHQEDFLFADGGEVEVGWLEGSRGRKRLDAPEDGVGACGRCQEPAAGATQVVHAGDSCPPPAARARLFAAKDGALEARPRRQWGFEEQEILRSVVEQIRLDWPGACANPRPDLAGGRVPSLEPISPPQDPWPVWALAQHEDGTLGLFGQGGQAVWRPSEGTTESKVDSSGRPRVAAPLPDEGARTARFLVASAARPDGTASQTVYDVFWVEQGTLSSSPVALDGVRDDVNFEAHWAGWLETPEGRRLALGGARGGRPELALCNPADGRLGCTSVAFGGVDCAEAGPILDLAVTARGWFAVTEKAYLQAEPTAGGTIRGWCNAPATYDLEVWSDQRYNVQPVLRSVGTIGSRVFVCAEPAGWDAHTIVLGADLGGEAPFDGAHLAYGVVADLDDSRCGDFGVPLDELGAASPTRLRLDLTGYLYDVFPAGGGGLVDGDAYFSQTNLPHTAVHQLAPGWIVHRTGWPTEPRALGSAILTRSATSEWTRVTGLERASSLVEVVARDNDLVAFNAFTDGDPYRLTLSDPPRLEEIPQAARSALEVDRREGVEDAVFWPSTQETLLIGNSREAADGSIRDNDDKVWKPFLRRLSPALDGATDVGLPRERGQFVCDAEWLVDDLLLIVGGQGTLLLFDGQGFERVAVEYDDRLTEPVEEAPINTNSGVPTPHFLSVSVAGGVAWVGGDRGLVVRVAREGSATGPRWVARRVSLDRVGPEGSGTPLSETTRFTHVVALAPDEAVFAAQRRTRYIFRGCPRPRRERHPNGIPGWVRIGPDEAGATPWPLYWQPWTGLPEPARFPELVSGGLLRHEGRMLAFGWEGLGYGAEGATELPFYPSAAAVGPAGRLVLVGPNLRVAVSR